MCNRYLNYILYYLKLSEIKLFCTYSVPLFKIFDYLYRIPNPCYYGLYENCQT